MKDYGRDFQGSIKIQEVSSLPVWAATDDRRIIKCTDTQKLYLGTTTGWFEINPASDAVYGAGWNGVTTIPPSKNAVYDKIESINPYTIPVGSIIVWPLEYAPSGFIECNGASISRVTYSALFSVLSTRYGAYDAYTFRIPDYRGFFLRAWDHWTGRDPDRAYRSARGDGTIGDNVGTYQGSVYGWHVHSASNLVGAPLGYDGDFDCTSEYARACDGRIGIYNTDGSGGSETRPINVNVMYCIKY